MEQRVGCRSLLVRRHCSSRKPRSSTAPSFSWASFAGTSKVKELQWQWWSPGDKVKQAYKILEIHCPAAGQSPYGTVSDGFVRLHGHVLAIKLRNQQVRLPFNSISNAHKTCEQRAIAFMDRDLIIEMTTERDFVCLLGFTWSEGYGEFGRSQAEGVGLDIGASRGDVCRAG